MIHCRRNSLRIEYSYFLLLLHHKIYQWLLAMSSVIFVVATIHWTEMHKCGFLPIIAKEYSLKLDERNKESTSTEVEIEDVYPKINVHTNNWCNIFYIFSTYTVTHMTQLIVSTSFIYAIHKIQHSRYTTASQCTNLPEFPSIYTRKIINRKFWTDFQKCVSTNVLAIEGRDCCPKTHCHWKAIFLHTIDKSKLLHVFSLFFNWVSMNWSHRMYGIRENIQGDRPKQKQKIRSSCFFFIII